MPPVCVYYLFMDPHLFPSVCQSLFDFIIHSHGTSSRGRQVAINAGDYCVSYRIGIIMGDREQKDTLLRAQLHAFNCQLYNMMLMLF